MNKKSYTHFSFEERETLSLGLAQGSVVAHDGHGLGADGEYAVAGSRPATRHRAGRIGLVPPMSSRQAGLAWPGSLGNCRPPGCGTLVLYPRKGEKSHELWMAELPKNSLKKIT